MKLNGKITKGEIDKFLKTARNGERLIDGLLKGFKLRKYASKNSFIYEYKANGEKRSITIGDYPSITPNTARQTAQELANDVARGIDPQQEKDKAKQLKNNTGLYYLENIYIPFHYERLANRQNAKAYENYLRKHFSDLLKKPMNELKRLDIQHWQKSKETATGKKKKLSYSTIERYYKEFKAMLNHAVKQGLLDSNPLSDVNLVKTPLTPEEIEAQREKRDYLRKEQIQAFFMALDKREEEKRQERRNTRKHGKGYLASFDGLAFTDHVKPMLLIMFYTGMRNGDVYNLKWEHINLNPFTPQINKVLNKTQHHDPYPLSISIPSQLVEVLTAWHEQQGNPQKGYVFINPEKNTCYKKGALDRPWKKIVELSNGLLDGKQSYTLRHNFISWLVMDGKPLLSIAKMVGHKSTKMIEQHYGHLAPELMREQAQDFANLFETPNTTNKTTTEKSK